MTKSLFTLATLLLGLAVYAQPDTEKIGDSIQQEAQRLYRSEMASWYGTDIFLEKFKDQRSRIGGYFSYSDKDAAHCIFFSKDEEPRVLATITFDSTYNVNTAKVDSKDRGFTPAENDIYTIRKLALADINSDTLYKSYQNTNLNIIPLIYNGQKKVYVLTGPQVHGVVVLGNDYLITFDSNNKLTSRRSLHKNIIPINYSKGGDEGAVTMHSHLPETGDFITATDICTLMLYKKLTKWEQHIVLSKNYVSLWDFQKSTLAILTTEAWKKISQDK